MLDLVTTWTGTRYPIDLTIRPDTSDEKCAVEVINDNVYQRPRLGFTIDPGDRWLDAGANIGAFSALVAHLGGTAVAVEPVTDHVHLTTLNTSDTLIIHGAVTPPGDRDRRTIHIRPPEVAWRSTTLPAADAVGTELVDAYPIDELVAAFDLTAVKLDIEGGEIPILESWAPPPQVRKVAFEWSFDVDPSIPRLRAVIRLLEADGFRVSTHTNVMNGTRAASTDTWTWFPFGLPVFAWR